MFAKTNFSLYQIDANYSMKYLLLHEISHILGFSRFVFQNLNFIYSETVNGEEIFYINSTKVIEKAKIHFNCENIKGVALENQGGDGSAGSHWEARYMLGDYMISTDYPEVVISDITLAYFEDTGFYKVNYYSGGLFRFGKNQGCAFLEEKCVKDNGKSTSFTNDFCLEEYGPFCGSSHISRGFCLILEYSEKVEVNHYENELMGGLDVADYCPVSYAYDEDLYDYYVFPSNCAYGFNYFEDEGEVLGDKSLCFESSLTLNKDTSTDINVESMCYRLECDKNNKVFNVYVNDSIINCPGNETILQDPNGFKGQIKCPDYNIVCSSKTWCNELFDCINKKSEADPETFYYNKNNEEKDDSNSNLKPNTLAIPLVFVVILTTFLLFLKVI